MEVGVLLLLLVGVVCIACVVVGFIIIFRNKSGRRVHTPHYHSKEVEKEVRQRTAGLEEAIERLQEIDRVKTEFIALASHQLRTPLTGLRWAIHALLEGQAGTVTSEQRTILTRSLDRAEAMMGLVGELLDVARIEDEGYHLVKEKVNVGEAVELSVDQFKEAASRRDISLVVSVEEDIPELSLDKNKLNIAIANIIDNAVKYTRPGGSVNVRVYKADTWVVISITDTGIGIPKTDVYRTFSKFFRSSNAIAMHTRGSGLGLYIVDKIIRKHSGTVEVQSEEGKGTTFTIKLPIQS